MEATLKLKPKKDDGEVVEFDMRLKELSEHI